MQLAKQLFTDEEFLRWVHNPTFSELKLRMDHFDFELQKQVWNKLLVHSCFDRNDSFAIARLRMMRNYGIGKFEVCRECGLTEEETESGIIDEICLDCGEFYMDDDNSDLDATEFDLIGPSGRVLATFAL
jgi:hypothetical protein